jgi:hypothetical protein
MDMTTVPLSGDPVPRPTVPVEWSARFRYDPTARSISCLGALTTNEREIIKGFSTDETYLSAVEEMFQKPRTILKQLASALKEQDVPELNAEDILAESVWVNDSPRGKPRFRTVCGGTSARSFRHCAIGSAEF